MQSSSVLRKRAISRRFGDRPLSACLLALVAGACLVAPRVWGQSSPGVEPPYFAIRGARIVTVSGPAIENGTVVIAKGVITAVGTDVAIPPEAWVIDGKGFTVYPGLIDAMSEVGMAAPAAEHAGAGGGGGGGGGAPRVQITSRGPEDRPNTTPWRSAADELNPEDKRMETWRDGGFTTVGATPQGGYFSGRAAVVDLAGERMGDMVVEAPTALPISLTPLGGFFNFPGSLMGTIAYVRQVFLDTAWYDQAANIYEEHPQGIERPRYDRTERVLDQVVRSHEPVLIPANNSIQLFRAIWLADQLKVRAVIYGGQQGYDVAAQLAASKLPVLVNLKWPEAAKDADPEAETPLRELRFRDRAPSTPAALEKAGVKFAFYSGGLSSPKETLKAAKKAIDAGLAPDAALRALTINAAEVLGVADRLGSIEPGKIANLAVTDGDIFSEKAVVKFVFVDGRRFQVHEPEKPKEPPKGDMTGKWKFSYTAQEGPEESTADLTMASDGTLTGTITGPHGTLTISSGWVSGNKFSITVAVPIEGAPTDVTLSGTFEGNTAKGSFTVGGSSIDFTATRPSGGLTAAARE
jgi:imidazolonepropionase-like amidohydrolase